MPARSALADGRAGSRHRMNPSISAFRDVIRLRTAVPCVLPPPAGRQVGFAGTRALPPHAAAQQKSLRRKRECDTLDKDHNFMMDFSMAGFDSAAGPAGVVTGLIEKAAAELDTMSDAAGEIAPEVGDLTGILVEAQRVADRAALDLRRLARKVPRAAD